MRYLLRTIVAACLLTSYAHAQEDDPAQSRQQLLQKASQLMQSGDLDQLKAIVAEAENAQLKAQLQSMLLSGYLRSQDYDNAYAMLSEQVRQGLKGADGAAGGARLPGNMQLLMSIASRAGKGEEAMAIIDDAIAQAAPRGDAQPSMQYLELVGYKVSGLMMQQEREQASKLAEELLTMVRSVRKANPDSAEALTMLVDALGMNAQVSGDAEKVARLQGEAEALVTEAISENPDNQQLIARFASLSLNNLMQLSRTDAAAAEKKLAEVREQFAALGEKSEKAQRALSGYARSLDSVERRIESEMKLSKLVGTMAPAIDAKHWVNAAGMTAEDLDGKVVLLDFWAIWCGPCIQTFPHLREWNEEYGDKGLQIVGVTRKYGYEWNEEAKRAVRAEGEVSDEQEIDMLEKFLAHHELEHPTIITPEGSEMQSAYAVSGIPHAVLIDRKGVIRMIKVGSGEANAKALHDEIEKLLAE